MRKKAKPAGSAISMVFDICTLSRYQVVEILTFVQISFWELSSCYDTNRGFSILTSTSTTETESRKLSILLIES